MYILRTEVFTFSLTRFLNITGQGLLIVGLLITVIYIWRQRKKVQTYIGISLRYVWIAMFLSLVLVNLILFNVEHQVHFELQHPVFMVIIAFATVVTGGILRHQLIIIGGIVFGLLALYASYLPLSTQLLMEAVAWIIAFIIPGHVLLATRKR
jgi:Na+-translocating ferredoxin:NAD+ oxidoreductase RnfE subunit